MKRKWVIWVAVAQHLVWFTCLIFGGPDMQTLSALWVLASYIPNNLGLACLMGFSAVTSAVGALRGKRGPWGLIWAMPQQVVLIISAAGCVQEIITLRLPDGSVRTLPFVLGAVSIPIILAIFHTVALIEYYGYHSVRR